ncbi:MAG: alpha/beta hydrolase [Leptospiraceae bacterium]|nr:alpha/beta hydrolase [Leptospiraceae bacterium]
MNHLFKVSIFILFTLENCISALYSVAIYKERSSSGLTIKKIFVPPFNYKYLEGGNDKKETLVFVHGFAAEKDHWTRLGKFFTDKYRVIALDLPGHGENDRIQEENYSVTNQVKNLHKFLEAIGVKKFHLIGNSMGGGIAGIYSTEYPDSVLSLSLITAAGINSPIKSDLSVEVAKGKNPLILNSVEDFDKLMSFTFVKPPYIPYPIKSYFAERSLQRAEFNRKMLTDIRTEEFPLEKKLSSIKTRTLVIWGDSDRILHVSSTEVIQKKVKNSKVVIIKDCGHAPMLEKPEETAKILNEFIEN